MTDSRNFFDLLSKDLVLEVFKKTRQKDLAALAQANKRFNALTDDMSLRPTIKVWDLAVTGKSHFFSVNRNSKIVDLKQQIENKIGLKVHQQELIFFNRKLNNEKKVHIFDDKNKSLILAKQPLW